MEPSKSRQVAARPVFRERHTVTDLGGDQDWIVARFLVGRQISKVRAGTSLGLSMLRTLRASEH
jgi:hypothetical protein